MLMMKVTTEYDNILYYALKFNYSKYSILKIHCKLSS